MLHIYLCPAQFGVALTTGRKKVRFQIGFSMGVESTHECAECCRVICNEVSGECLDWQMYGHDTNVYCMQFCWHLVRAISPEMLVCKVDCGSWWLCIKLHEWLCAACKAS